MAYIHVLILLVEGPCAPTRPFLPRAPFSLLTFHFLHIPGPIDPPPTHYTPSAGLLDDLHWFDPTTMTWTLLSAEDDVHRPSARSKHGFTSVGGLLYVHGGYGLMGANGNAGG